MPWQIGPTNIQRMTGPSSRVQAGEILLDASAVQLPDKPCSEVLLQADPTNVDNVTIGDATSQPIVLLPGNYLVIPLMNLNLLWARAEPASALLNWMVRG